MNGEKAPQHFNIIHADMIDPVSVKSIVEDNVKRNFNYFNA